MSCRKPSQPPRGPPAPASPSNPALVGTLPDNELDQITIENVMDKIFEYIGRVPVADYEEQVQAYLQLVEEQKSERQGYYEVQSWGSFNPDEDAYWRVMMRNMAQEVRKVEKAGVKMSRTHLHQKVPIRNAYDLEELVQIYNRAIGQAGKTRDQDEIREWTKAQLYIATYLHLVERFQHNLVKELKNIPENQKLNWQKDYLRKSDVSTDALDLSREYRWYNKAKEAWDKLYPGIHFSQ